MARETIIRAKEGGYVKVIITKAQAIKLACTECCGWSEMNPKECPDKFCPLHIFRGKMQLAYQDGKTLEELEKQVPVSEIDPEPEDEDEMVTTDTTSSPVS